LSQRSDDDDPLLSQERGLFKSSIGKAGGGVAEPATTGAKQQDIHNSESLFSANMLTTATSKD